MCLYLFKEHDHGPATLLSTFMYRLPIHQKANGSGSEPWLHITTPRMLNICIPLVPAQINLNRISGSEASVVRKTPQGILMSTNGWKSLAYNLVMENTHACKYILNKWSWCYQAVCNIHFPTLSFIHPTCFSALHARTKHFSRCQERRKDNSDTDSDPQTLVGENNFTY